MPTIPPCSDASAACLPRCGGVGIYGVPIDTNNSDDTLPCRSDFAPNIEAVKKLLTELAQTNPELIEDAGLDAGDWEPLLRAAIESMRGSASATMTDKRRFISAVLDHCKDAGLVTSWESIGAERRQDYRVELPDGTLVAVEAKGCGDGNNLTIWDRPTWADEFIIWSLCPDSLQHNPGHGVWSAVSTRLMPKIAADHKVVDALIFWDGRCGSRLRQCPKRYGVTGLLRGKATDIKAQKGSRNWLPPPCVYLFPRSAPTVPHNTSPVNHTVTTGKFARMLLTAFNVPDAEMASYVHDARVQARGSTQGTQIEVSTVSRCWPDGEERVHTGRWKPIRREQ